MNDSKSLSGKLALITGASRGIGAATAEALAAAGAHVILVARTASALEEVEEKIHAAGGNATIAPLDLTDGEGIGKLAGAVAERWQKLDILVLNAAMLGSLTPVQDIDPKEYSRILSTNLLANQALIAAFDRLLKNADQADVVALTSSVGAEPRAFWGAYGSSRPGENPHRRPGRDPDPNARQCLPRRRTGAGQAARDRGVRDPRTARRRLTHGRENSRRGLTASAMLY